MKVARTYATTPREVVGVNYPDSAEVVEVRGCKPKLRDVNHMRGTVKGTGTDRFAFLQKWYKVGRDVHKHMS